MATTLASIRIVLINTFHPGNIGSAARAMKTMGLNELVLVKPKSFPDSLATSLAAGANDLLTKAKVVNTFEEAISDCTQVFATSARKEHSFNRPQRSAEQTALWIKAHTNEKIAIVFGGERDGMTSQEIDLCQQITYVPGNPAYSVLNIASAVQIVCYELYKTLGNDTLEHQKSDSKTPARLVSQDELNRFYLHLEGLLLERSYIRKEQPSDSLKKLRKFISRAEPTGQDIALLRGMIKALSREIKN